jgi:maltose alpha-D-glucosyltransferase / alpha-amylase
VLYDAMWDDSFATALLAAVVHRRRFQGIIGTATAAPTPELRRLLTKREFLHTPKVVGAIEYCGKPDEPITLAILQAFVPNQGELWETTQTQLRAYFERAGNAALPDEDRAITAAALLELAEREPPAQARELIGGYLDSAQLLGKRTAELHLALVSDVGEANFVPLPFTTLYQRSLYQSMRSLVSRVCDDLRRYRADLPKGVHADVQTLLDGEQPLLERLRSITVGKIDAVRIRCHGDYHLAQVLDTGDDLVIFDFEGESERPVLERLLKRAALEDVAAMLRSLHAATVVARQNTMTDGARQVAALEQHACFWTRWVGATFLRAYLTTAGRAPFVPPTQEQRAVLLDVLLIEKVMQQLDGDLREQPARLPTTLHHLAQVLGAGDLEDSSANA